MAKLKLIVNALVFQAGWLLSVFYGTPLAILIAISAAAIYYRFYSRELRDMLLIMGVTLLGYLGDSLIGFLDVVIYPTSSGLPPLWMVTMWLLFASTLPWSLSWLVTRRSWFVIAAIIGGTLSYIAGVNLSDIRFGLAPAGYLSAFIALWFVYGVLINLFYVHWYQPGLRRSPKNYA